MLSAKARYMLVYDWLSLYGDMRFVPFDALRDLSLSFAYHRLD